jgi:hypothetical protein
MHRLVLAITLVLTLVTAAHGQLSHADRVYFWSAVAANQAATAYDGVTTFRLPRYYPESDWPRGSAQLYGRYPTVYRYALVSEGLNLAEFASGWFLMHSHHRWLRTTGRVLIADQTIEHLQGGTRNLFQPLPHHVHSADEPCTFMDVCGAPPGPPSL